MKTKYKILALMPLMTLIGCKNYHHKNVITEIGTVDEQKVLIVKDVETNQDRIYKISGNYYKHVLPYFQKGDTVVFRVGRQAYTGNLVLDANTAYMIYNSDSIYARQQREKFNDLLQKMRSITR